MNEKKHVQQVKLSDTECSVCGIVQMCGLVCEHSPNREDCYLCGDCLSNILESVDDAAARAMAAEAKEKTNGTVQSE